MKVISLPLCCVLTASWLGAAPLTVGSSVPGFDPGGYRITTFASGLFYPTAISGASGGGLLLASGFSGASVRRLVDSNDDGMADGVGVPVIQLVGNGPISSMANNGAVVALGVQGRGIRLFAPGNNPDDPYTDLGSISVAFSPGASHTTPGVALRPTPGASGSYDLFFALGAAGNNSTGADVTLSGLATGTVPAGSIYRLTLTPNGSGWNASGLTHIAKGLRNVTAMDFAPNGDLYLADNGIDGLVNPDEPESADELNRIPAAAIGAGLVDFGFPASYVQYRTGTFIGGAGTVPLTAFQPIPNPLNGSEAEGAASLAFSPALFPGAWNGVFVSFYGRDAAANGLENEENPIAYYDFDTGHYYHFVSNDEPGVFKPVGLYASSNALFSVDIGTGEVYQIAAIPEPSSWILAAGGLLAAGWWRRRQRL